MDLKGLLGSRDDEAPSGENLEYDPEFIALELAAQPGEERQVGDSIVQAEDPDWGEVKDKALSVLERSHDLRAAIYLAHASLFTDGLQGFAEVTGYIRGVLEQYWPTCFPELDADDDNDPTERVNAVRNLAEPSGVLSALRRAPLSESRGFGRMSLRDILIARGEITSEDDGPDSGRIAAAFADSDAEVLSSRFEAIRVATENVNAIDKVFDSEVPGQGPDFTELKRMLRQISTALGEHVSGDAAEAEDAGEAAVDGGFAEAGAASSGGAAPARAPSAPPGSINSLNDVHSALDRIMAFYARSEPSSPVPVLLTRAKKLVGADFLTIMKDMAPKGLDNVRLIGGLEDDDD